MINVPKFNVNYYENVISKILLKFLFIKCLFFHKYKIKIDLIYFD